MTGERIQVTEVILRLDEAEAKWLKELVQNQLVHDETRSEQEMRESLFNILDEPK